MPDVWWGVLLERSIPSVCVDSLMDVAIAGERRGYKRIKTVYTRTDFARNAMYELFMKLSSDPHDTLIMLDNDHDHPDDVLYGLARHNEWVVGALAFRRGPPHDPCVFVRDDQGRAHAMARWEPGHVYKCDVIGHAAIAIQRRTFLRLEEAGIPKPYWRYRYTDGTLDQPSEDFWFSERLHEAGVPLLCDTAVMCPHLTNGWVDHDVWHAYVKDHPELVGTDEELAEAGIRLPGGNGHGNESELHHG